jgi:predicted ATPase
MNIKKLEYYDDEYKWRLAPVNFLPNLNLLVGVSGAGKTKILKAINGLKDIANGGSFNGVEWDFCFSAADDDGQEYEYCWAGKFETREASIAISEESEDNEEVKIIYEKLSRDHNIIIDRTQEAIIFEGVKTPKLSPFESAIELLKQEDIIAPIKKELNKIKFVEESLNEHFAWHVPVFFIRKYEQSTLLSLKESDLPLFVKLSILYRIFPNEFNQIKKIFTSIFPKVLDVQVEVIKNDRIPSELSDLLKEVTTILIKEKGIHYGIENMSSGMLKSLTYICELYLTPDNCTVLSDEFENSLGINCLDSVTDLISSNKSLQFIITSHHPYIINNFSPTCWRIVTRQGSLVTVKDAKDFHISESRQKAFIDLINVLEENDDGWEKEQ